MTREAKIAMIKEKMQLFFKRPVRAALLLFILLLTISFVSSNHKIRKIEEVSIRLLNEDDNYFIDDTDVLNIMTLDGSEWILGQTIGEIDLKKLEKRLNRNPYLERSEIYVDLKGQVNVKAWIKRPIARLIPPIGAQSYICRDGSLMPLSDRYSSRVMLVRGSGVKYIQNEDSLKGAFGMEFKSLIGAIDKDPFLKAQIAEIEIQRDKELILYPQVTKQRIEFGDISDFEVKMEKLNIFYREILPFKGWNSYEKVSLKFKNQIVCE